MLNLKPLKLSKIICILLIIILIFSSVNFIFVGLFGGEALKSKSSTKQEYNSQEILFSSDFHQDINTLEPAMANYEQNTVNVHSGLNEVTLYEYTDHNSSPRGTRSNSTYDYDLRIQRINITYQGLFWWNVNIGGLIYTYFIAGGIGEQTLFTITIKNVGKEIVDNNSEAFIKINLTDYFGHESWEQRNYLGHVMPNEELTLNFIWVPSYSNQFNLTCNISFSKDQNLSNNVFKVYNLHTKKWNDDFEDGNLNDWDGYISPNEWHLTNTIENDPNPNAHTSEYALYHGIEEDGNADDYGEANDFEIITPEIDLRRFEPGRPTYLNFKFYGISTEDKDMITFEGYKSSEQKWYPIDKKIPPTIYNESGWNIWVDFPFIGIDIRSYAGELARFKIKWQSDQTPENLTGFYLDDFFIYGFERPLPAYDVGIESVIIKPIDRPIVVGNEFEITTNITNYGTEQISNLAVDISVLDITGRSEIAMPFTNNIIEVIIPGESKYISWSVIPKVAGLYYINLSIELDVDSNKQNNFVSHDAVEVFKYYNSYEYSDPNWIFGDGWHRKNVTNDPNPDQHSRTHAYFVNYSNYNSSLPNNYYLYSPIIDLDGAQTNPIYKGVQVKIGFKWFGSGSVSDKLYFEYALDHTDNWMLFPTQDGGTSIISGDFSDKWYMWDSLGTTELFGHHIQFRWRFQPGAGSRAVEAGYYIDDFFVWIIQEQFGRPMISGVKVTPNSILNDSVDLAILRCEVKDNDLKEVYINLKPLAGPNKHMLYDDGTHGDVRKNDNIFTLELTAPPNVPEGEKILKLTAIDYDDNFDNNYVKLLIRENSPPKIEKHFPSNSTIILNESELMEFSVLAFDQEDKELQYSWYLNSALIKNWTKDYYEFATDFHGDFSSGNYVLGILVADNGYPSKTDYFEWNIEVRNILPDFQVGDGDLSLNKSNVTINEPVEIYAKVHNLQEALEYNVSIYFIQQSTNASVPDSIFNVINISMFPGKSNMSIHTKWKANLSYKYLKVWVDADNVIPELNENNNEAVIPINISSPPDSSVPQQIDNTTEKVDQLPIPLYITTIGLIAVIISIFATIATEFGNYKLYLMFAPLYYRVTGDKVLEHELRSKIYMYIRAHPGDHYRSIMANLEIKNGTLVHHLARLEQEELIKSERDGYFKRFYPVGMRIPKSDVGMYYPEGIATYNIGEHQVSEIQLQIINTIRKNPGLTQKEIAQKIKESRRVVNYHIKLLLQHDLIKVIKIGRKTQCFIAEKKVSS